MKTLTVMSGLLSMIVLLTIAQVEAAPPPLGAVRALAENVLGAGTVKSLSIVEDGTKVLMRWESATYKSANKLEVTRELLFAEAELATGSILGRLQALAAVRFSILVKNQVVANGENSRGKGVQLAFVPALGGGTYTPPPSKPKEGNPQKGGASDIAKD